MTDKQQNDQKEELRDLDLHEEHADEVKGGFGIGDVGAAAVAAAKAASDRIGKRSAK